MLPPFTLAPWELPPDCEAPLTAPADFVFRSLWQYSDRPHPRETEIWVRVVLCETGVLYFFCDGKRPHKGNWLLSNVEDILEFSHQTVDADLLQSLFRHNDSLWSDHAMRHVFFEGAPYGRPGPHRIVVRSDGICWLHKGISIFDRDIGDWAHFAFPFARKAPENAATMKNCLLATLHDVFSELRFTLDWLYLTPPQKRELLLRFERGNLTQMETLLRAALQSQPDIWERGQTLSWRVHNQNNHFTDVDKMRLVIPQPSALGIKTSSHSNPWIPGAIVVHTGTRLNRWKRTIWNYFKPSLNENLLGFAKCTQRFDFSTIEVHATPPTAHEHLESLLLLRDWWQQHFDITLFDAHNSDNELESG